ncbi:MAG: hypothetical protein KF718_27235 [Polyangiaceae bacterium]|nr:hypothetical protein [Polyangiaceae bacterium]
MTTPAVEARTTALEVAMTEMVRTVDRFGREMVDFKREMAALWQRRIRPAPRAPRLESALGQGVSNRLRHLVQKESGRAQPAARIAAPYLEPPPGCAPRRRCR